MDIAGIGRLRALDLAGTCVFALSGAALAVRARMDLFGVLVLAIVTAVSGGIIRDLLVGGTTPTRAGSDRPAIPPGVPPGEGRSECASSSTGSATAAR